jgi:hypothetical protein
MTGTVYIFAHQFAAIGVPTIDDPAAAAQRLSAMVQSQHFPCPDQIVGIAQGGASTAFLMAHQDAFILDTTSINNSMRVDAIARSSGAERYYLIDTHSQDWESTQVVMPFTLRGHSINSDNTGDILPDFIRKHGDPELRLHPLKCLDGKERLICVSDFPKYLNIIDGILDSDNVGERRTRQLTEMRQSLTISRE